MTPQQFITKWQRVQLSERSASQQHFLDLCELLEQPKPAAADPDGTEYTFERGVSKTGGGDGWADVWKRHHFGWEYKGKHKDLAAAYQSRRAGTLSRGPGEPAAPGRLRHGPIRGPHELHGHSEARVRL